MAGVERDLLKDVHRGTRDGEKEELITKIAKELTAAQTQMVQSAEWSLPKVFSTSVGKPMCQTPSTFVGAS